MCNKVNRTNCEHETPVGVQADLNQIGKFEMISQDVESGTVIL